LTFVFMNLGGAYVNMNKLDSALFYEKKAYQIANPGEFSYYFKLLKILGVIYTNLDNFPLAKKYFYLDVATDHSSNKNEIYSSMSLMYMRMGIRDSALYFANLGNQLAIVSKSPEDIIYARNALAQIYDSLHLPDSALKYQKQLMSLKDSIFGAQKLLNFQQVYFDDQARRKEIEEARTNYRTKLRMYALAAGLFILLIATVFLIRNNRVRKKTNALLEDQKKELQLSLVQLKATQSQLIQSEKMASLGELTAGIAHEIQNPLNFVNNFSEVNEELLMEMKDDLDKGKIEDAKALANDAIENQKKINYHGKRADAIVKGMLQHSRTSSGKKEPADINTLADEWLRLSYNGLRAKDKLFNATMRTDFDKSFGNINIISQDIGRVLLNLYNNAFYAVAEKKKQQPDGFEPTVFVSTKMIGDKPDSYRVEIRVKDNGNGISQKVMDKIFQPFFTTKPTGQGTGLGLSLAYDIVKAHGGELKVETKEGEGAEFIIELPAK
jgi:two-component system, NtrC family, sensor kinase